MDRTSGAYAIGGYAGQVVQIGLSAGTLAGAAGARAGLRPVSYERLAIQDLNEQANLEMCFVGYRRRP